MLDVLREEFLASRILRSIHDRPLSPPQIAQDMDEAVKKISPMLTDRAKEGRITIRGWEGGYPNLGHRPGVVMPDNNGINSPGKRPRSPRRRNYPAARRRGFSSH